MAETGDTTTTETFTPSLSSHGGEREGSARREGEGQFEALIERWWEDHFPGSAVARYTEAWNVAHSAKEALKALLKKGDKQCS
ncbi:MAG TPA: hypothetical protein VGR91_17315 [Stellaceae bacterium]|nr:hypothetical protein [Stellaceae bacterium]